MKTQQRTGRTPEYTVRPRQLGGFGIIDKFGKCRVTVATRDAADDWIARQRQQQQARQTQEVAA